MPDAAFDEIVVDHIEFYTADIDAQLDTLVGGFGFDVYSKGGRDPRVGSIGLGRNDIRLVLSQPLVDDHPGSAYVERHGDGVADIALRVPDARAAFEAAVRRGARAVSGPIERDGVVTATIGGFGDVLHTFVQRREGVDARALPGLRPGVEESRHGGGLHAVDHFAVCVEAGEMDPTVEFYERALDFELTFADRIVVGPQAIVTKAVQSRSRAVTLTLIEPDVSRETGQIDEFLKNHGGAGVQHVALVTDDIVTAVDSIRSRGVEFLTTPATYYSLMRRRLELVRHSLRDLRRLSILVDEDHDGQLFQIFTRTTHPRKTSFWEVIERLGAQTFGNGNITALYEAVELQRIKVEAAATISALT